MCADLFDYLYDLDKERAMTTPADLPTVRAAIAEALDDWAALSDRRLSWWIEMGGLPTFIHAKLCDPAVQDELAYWLVSQEDGPLEIHGWFWRGERWGANALISHKDDAYPVYRLRQRTRSEQG